MADRDTEGVDAGPDTGGMTVHGDDMIGSAVSRVQDGDIWLAAGAYSAGAVTGGVIRQASGLVIPWGHENSCAPVDPAVGTAIRLDWRSTVTHPSMATSHWGPRAIVNLEGLLRYSTDMNVFGFAPIYVGSMMAVANTPGQDRTLIPSWDFMSARLWAAQGASVTLNHNDMARGGAAFVDSQVFATVDGGSIVGADETISHHSFLSGLGLSGDVVLPRRVGYRVLDVNGGDYYTREQSAIICGTIVRDILDPSKTIAPETEVGTVEVNVGVEIDHLTHGRVSNIGLLNASSTVETPGSVEVTARTVLPVTYSVLHIRAADLTTVDRSAVIPVGENGQRVAITNVGAHTINLGGKVASGGHDPVPGSNLARWTRIDPGAVVTIRCDGSVWRLESPSSRVEIADGAVNVYASDDHRNGVVGLGALLGSGFLSFGAGRSSTVDNWLLRKGPGVLGFGSTLATTDGRFDLRYVGLNEVPLDPDAPEPNEAVIYTRDDGSGKTQLCVRFATGPVQVIASEP